MTKVYEAFVPSGTEGTATHSQGLYTGDPSAIKDWVAENSSCWKNNDVTVYEREVKALTRADVEALQKAKKEAEATKANALLESLKRNRR